MVRPPQSHHQDEEDDDADDVAAATDTSSHREGKGTDQKPSNYRSKHSETEQRRRSKINERFQILRGLIPPNDQKRDKASLLLEVIEYIHFLQEKLQVYEGSCQQIWDQEPSKLTPWRANQGLVDNLGYHFQAMRNDSMNDNDNGAAQPLTNLLNAEDPGISAEYAYRGSDHPLGHENPPIPPNIPLQPSVYPLRNIPHAENVGSQSSGFPVNESAVVGNERMVECGSSSLSSIYSQGLLTKLTEALHTSGVDLSRANISVQLDVCKQPNHISSAALAAAEDGGKQSARNLSGSRSGEVSGKEFLSVTKKPRTGER